MNRLSTQPSHTTLHPFNRRSFLTGAIGLTLSNLLMGCSGQNGQTLSLRVLNGSIPPQLVVAFRKYLQQTSTAGALDVAIEPQLLQLFEQLQTWKRQGQVNASGWFSWVPFVGKRTSTAVPDLVTLGDYWLEKAIQQELIQPLDPTQWQGWEQLPSEWQALVTRRASAETPVRVWAAPYRWGSTVIAYRQDIFKEKGLQPPTDWSDLWRSDLRGHLSLLDQPREVIGLTLKKLGKSYNTTNLQAVSQLKAELTALNQQVKLYSSDAYLQPLLLGDTWLAVGWSTDILPLTQRNQTIAAIVPKAGTALWADLWVRPTAARPELSSLIAHWISFCWRPEIATQLSLISRAASPAVLEMPLANLPDALRQNSLLLPVAAIRQSSEFLKPLDRATAEEYQALWQHLRQVV
ncbi:extracellular solute-binding protein [Stenomitos frigidus]|uniref:Polyamine ABC transporter substrate-binding protein n=1 Tax=Stenomitos frigidus ULC18 TaxID=2107698 RepID=A0A2T1DZI5_9CYAN|nr:extracellular solute-binding protein [Stenomitos frigidus]PSB25861.1 polyamine ABC transporter substrate-binding protein [Stenomitos frigidus ULC18]